MKTTVARDCTCGKNLRLPLDATEVLPPDLDEKEKEKELEAVPKTRRKKFIRKPGEPLVLSTKMRWLHDELIRNSKRNPHSQYYNAFEIGEELEETDADGRPFLIKSVVLWVIPAGASVSKLTSSSQWTTMLDRIGDMLDTIKITYVRLDGTMSRDERTAAMHKFQNNKKIEVMLVSTRAGGVGLNLVAASRAYLIDPYW
jgi:SWI/SNF-related matrix-associated actin-dependent regulator of chromatin subfamily A3